MQPVLSQNPSFLLHYPFLINRLFQFSYRFEIPFLPAKIACDLGGLAHLEEGVQLEDFRFLDLIDTDVAVFIQQRLQDLIGRAAVLAQEVTLFNVVGPLPAGFLSNAT